jgi:hypothetical protein
MKMADSAAMRESIPTRPREGSSHGSSVPGMVIGVALIGRSSLLVPPVRIFRVLEIPERPATSDRWNQREVICGRRRGRGPLECPGVPWIAPCTLASEVGPEQVSTNQYAGGLKDHANGRQEIPDVPTASGFVVYTLRGMPSIPGMCRLSNVR